jgi:microbial collagenase
MNTTQKIIAFVAGVTFAMSSMAKIAPPLLNKPVTNPNHFEHISVLKRDQQRVNPPLAESVLPKQAKQTKRLTSKFYRSSLAKTSTTSSNTCTVSEAASLNSTALVQYIRNCDMNDFYGSSGLFDNSDYTKALFSSENLAALATAYDEEVNELFQTGDVVNLVNFPYFIRAFYFLNFWYPTDFPTPDNAVHTKAINTTRMFLDSDAAYDLARNNADNVGIGDAVALADALDDNVYHIPNLIRFMDAAVEAPQYGYGQYVTMFSVFYAIDRRSTGSDDVTTAFRDAWNNTPDVVSHIDALLARLYDLTTQNPDDTYYAQNFNSALWALGIQMDFPNHFAQAESASVSWLNTFERMSNPWIQVVLTLDYYSDCTKWNICREDLEDEMLAHAFPNTFIFDDGNMVIHTAISENEAQALYHAAKQVEAQFKRAIQDLNPLSDDPNPTLTMYVYGTRSDYEVFQPYLFNLGTDNGGIYIEQWGQFFTYQRTEAESIYTLEELFRHEYVHYLNGRFAVAGLWGEAQFYENERLTWWDEGSAEFFAGATQANGVPVRKSMMMQIVSDGVNRFTVSDVLSASYNGGFKFYRYAALFFNFLNETRPDKITELYKLVTANDIAGFDALVADMASDASLQAEYDAFIDAKVAAYNSMPDFQPIEFPPVNTLVINDVSTIQQYIRGQLPNTSCSEVFVGLNTRFGCTGQLEVTDVKSLNATLDTAITSLVETGINNFQTLVCAYGEIRNNTTQYYCEGGIRRAGVDLPNTAPVVDAGVDQTVDENTQVTLTATASDADGNTLTYTWTQTGGPSVEFSGANSDTITFTAPDVESATEITFEVEVSDGIASVSDTVVVTVNNVETDNGGNGNGGTDTNVGTKNPQTGSSGGGSLGYILLLIAFVCSMRRKLK